MYAEAMADDGAPPAPGQPRVTLFRVNPHMERLEAAMEAHLQSLPRAKYDGSQGAAAAPPTTTAGAPSKKKAKAGRPVAAASGGFGGGGGTAKGKAKTKGKKKR